MISHVHSERDSVQTPVHRSLNLLSSVVELADRLG